MEAGIKAAAGALSPQLWRQAGRAVLAALLVVGFARWTPAGAQAPVAVQALTVELWPEFDQPAVLVILRATLDPAVPLPAVVTVHLPAGVAGPSAVAAQDPSGQLLNTVYTATAASEAVAVEVQTNYASFQVEYYDTTLRVTGENRTYHFQWVADFPVAAATLRVQEPAGARDLTATPAVTLAGASGLGLNYYTAALGALTTGQAVTVDLGYAKTAAVLSQGAAAPAATRANVAATVIAAPSPMLSPAIAIGGGFVVLAALGFGAGRVLRTRVNRGSGRPRSRTAIPPASSAVVTAAVAPIGPTVVPTAARFCTQCGQPAAENDRFCRKCGAPRRGVPPPPPAG